MVPFLRGREKLVSGMKLRIDASPTRLSDCGGPVAAITSETTGESIPETQKELGCGTYGARALRGHGEVVQDGWGGSHNNMAEMLLVGRSHRIACRWDARGGPGYNPRDACGS